MPFVRAGSKIVYYAHIPKCAGSAVEHYLSARFGPIALLDQTYHRLPTENRWSRTSPQHIDSTALARILPDDMIDHAFAIVRHPVKRLVSVFKFQKDVEKLIPEEMKFSSWLCDLAEQKDGFRFHHDNHLLPQTDFLPNACTVFHLEHGLDPLIAYFDEIVGAKDGPAEFQRVNDGAANAKHQGANEKAAWSPTPDDIKIISSIYSEDFKQLGYKPDEYEPLVDRPKVVSLASSDRDTQINAPRRLIARGLRYALGVVETS